MSEQFFVAQLGARRHYSVPLIFHSAGLLGRFCTDIWLPYSFAKFAKGSSRWLPSSMRRSLTRTAPALPTKLVDTSYSIGLQYWWRLRQAKDSNEIESVHLWASSRFAKFAREVGSRMALHAYAFNSAALEILEAAREQDRRAVLDQTHAPLEIENQIAQEEHHFFPEWEQGYQPQQHISERIERQWSEWKVADTILVASEFVKRSIRSIGGPADRCVVVPYGYDCPPANIQAKLQKKKLHILLVGGVRLQKGIQYALPAAKAMRNEAEFRIVGTNYFTPQITTYLRRYFEFVGQVPRPEIQDHYRWADVLLFPSLCDGFGSVIIEALGFGVPVITTPNTGVVVREGLDGFVIPIRDGQAIHDRLCLLNENRLQLQEMSFNARARAEEFNSKAYARRIVQAVCPSEVLLGKADDYRR